MDHSHTRPLEFTFIPQLPIQQLLPQEQTGGRGYEWTFKTPNPVEIDVESIGRLKETVSKTEEAIWREEVEGTGQEGKDLKKEGSNASWSKARVSQIVREG
jgi:hypothetical protein